MLRGAETLLKGLAHPTWALASQSSCSAAATGSTSYKLNFFRCITLTSSSWYPDVVIPPMGESVSEGTIATVLKQVGNTVKAEEVIAQIETDKVTVDLKAPVSGILEHILIKAGDVVAPGQKVASIQETDASVAEAVALTTPVSMTSPSTPVPSASQASMLHRTPSIHFPPRRTEAGQRISDMSAAEAHTYLKPPQPPAAQTPQPAQSAQSPSPPVPPKPAVGQQPAATAKVPFFGSTQHSTGGLRSRELSAREMEIITLGGADP